MTTSLSTAAQQASTDFSAWTSPDFAKVKDPMKLVGRVMAAMSVAMGNLMRTMTTGITDLTDRMSRMNTALQKINEQLGITKGETDQNKALDVMTKMTAADKDLLKATFAEAKLNPDINIWQERADGWAWVTHVRYLQSNADGLRIGVDSLGTTSQAAQLQLNTLMGRYTSCFEVVTNCIKKGESQAGSAVANFRR